MCKLCEFKSYVNLEEQGLLLRLPCKVVANNIMETLWKQMVSKVETFGKRRIE